MNFEVVIYFLICGAITSMILNRVIMVIKKFIELSERLGTLIEVTYCATHDPDFKPELSDIKSSIEENQTT